MTSRGIRIEKPMNEVPELCQPEVAVQLNAWFYWMLFFSFLLVGLSFYIISIAK